jgi:hypothetical protein
MAKAAIAADMPGRLCMTRSGRDWIAMPSGSETPASAQMPIYLRMGLKFVFVEAMR